MPAIISTNAETLLKARYLAPDESIEGMFRRISMGNPKYYDLVSNLYFLPNSPTIFNLGLNNGCTFSACFTEDTVIHTLAGDFTVKELLASGCTKFDVYSTDGDKLRIGKAFALRKTRTLAKVYEVTFDSGDAIKLTADHLVMMRDGPYKEVRRLKAGDSVMPFNNAYWNVLGHLRRHICPNISDRKVSAYRWAWEEANERPPKPHYDIHHKDGNPMNDAPDNLEELSNAEHASTHMTQDNPMHRPEVAAKVSEAMKGNKRGVGPKPGTAKATQGNQHALKNEPHPDPRTQQMRMYMRNRLRNKRAGKPRSEWNHKVVSVKFVGREDVYDLSVHKYHNFAANGIFIHNCFVFSIEDSMFGKGSITETRAKAAAVAKAGGGVGYYFGKIRRKGALIKTVHRKACGPVAVLRDMHGVRQLITQGGKRDLAQMGVLPIWHDDIEEFMDCKNENPKALESFNISVSWPNSWIEKVDFNWDQKSEPNKATRLWWKQCLSAWLTGCPGMLFYDHVNNEMGNPNPHLGMMDATNPCAETPNRSDEPCSLGSQSLARYVNLVNRKFNWDLYLDHVATCVEYMDDVLDRNEFPHPDITAAALLTRKLGLGVMGWADCLALMGIQYDSPAALQFALVLGAKKREVEIQTSMKLAKKKGPYPGWDNRSLHPMRRNETNSSIAPTGSIAIVANVWGSIEPYYALATTRVTNEGIVMEDGVPGWVNENLEGFVPKTAHQIKPADHIRMQAAWQSNTELGVSKTCNIPNNATVKDVSEAYRLMHKLGCKGGTIYRDGCRSEQVLREKEVKSVYSQGVEVLNGRVVTEKVTELQGNPPQGVRHKFTTEHQALTKKFTVAGTKGYLTVGLYEDGKPGEIFVRFSKAGSTLAGMLDAWAMSVSVSLQYGTPLESLVRLYSGQRFDPCGLTDCKEVPICSSIPDYIVRWLEKRFLKTPAEDGESIVMSGEICPDCGAELARVAGCLSCLASGCGFSKC